MAFYFACFSRTVRKLIWLVPIREIRRRSGSEATTAEGLVSVDDRTEFFLLGVDQQHLGFH